MKVINILYFTLFYACLFLPIEHTAAKNPIHKTKPTKLYSYSILTDTLNSIKKENNSNFKPKQIFTPKKRRNFIALKNRKACCLCKRIHCKKPHCKNKHLHHFPHGIYPNRKIKNFHFEYQYNNKKYPTENSFRIQYLKMHPDYEGSVISTIISRRAPVDSHKAILYIHGYNDYFFQTHLADSINKINYNFYALDLRKYGRSHLSHQVPFYCENINEYFPDIDRAIRKIRRQRNDTIIIMAHSTGGLIASLYLAQKGASCKIDGLILNSPFLDMNLGFFMETFVEPIVSWAGKYIPQTILSPGGVPSQYAHSLLKRFHGEWIFREDLKHPKSLPIRFGWFRAIHLAHQKIEKGLALTCPVLVLSSSRSLREKLQWDPNFMTHDIVLDVKDIHFYSKKLGNQVTYITIPNGIHDLSLSPLPARTRFFSTFRHWLEEKFPTQKPQFN